MSVALNINENLLMKIDPCKGFMFRIGDFVKIPFGVFVGIIGFGTYEEFVIFFLFALGVNSFIIYNLLKRFIKCRKTSYLITNERIIFCVNNKIKKSFLHDNVENLFFWEWFNNKGYIELGDKEELFGRKGINLVDSQDVLDNLNNFKEVEKLLKMLSK